MYLLLVVVLFRRVVELGPANSTLNILSYLGSLVIVVKKCGNIDITLDLRHRRILGKVHRWMASPTSDNLMPVFVTGTNSNVNARYKKP